MLTITKTEFSELMHKFASMVNTTQETNSRVGARCVALTYTPAPSDNAGWDVELNPDGMHEENTTAFDGDQLQRWADTSVIDLCDEDIDALYTDLYDDMYRIEDENHEFDFAAARRVAIQKHWFDHESGDGIGAVCYTHQGWDLCVGYPMKSNSDRAISVMCPAEINAHNVEITAYGMKDAMRRVEVRNPNPWQYQFRIQVRDSETGEWENYGQVSTIYYRELKDEGLHVVDPNQIRQVSEWFDSRSNVTQERRIVTRGYYRPYAGPNMVYEQIVHYPVNNMPSKYQCDCIMHEREPNKFVEPDHEIDWEIPLAEYLLHSLTPITIKRGGLKFPVEPQVTVKRWIEDYLSPYYHESVHCRCCEFQKEEPWEMYFLETLELMCDEPRDWADIDELRVARKTWISSIQESLPDGVTIDRDTVTFANGQNYEDNKSVVTATVRSVDLAINALATTLDIDASHFYQQRNQ